MMDEITFRWIDGPSAKPEDIEKIEDVLSARGWMSLNPSTSRILVAERAGELKGFIVLQLIPHTEPLWVAPSMRSSGIAETLADKMAEFMAEVHARGYMVVAEHPSAAKLCEERGMKRVDAPVYVKVGD